MNMNNQRDVERLSGWGRGGDTTIAHLTPGEMVLPRGVQNDPNLMALIQIAMKKRGLNPDEYVVGHNEAKVNPHTGAQEFYEEAGDGPSGRGGERGYGGGRTSDGRGNSTGGGSDGGGGSGGESSGGSSSGRGLGGREGNGGRLSGKSSSKQPTIPAPKLPVPTPNPTPTTPTAPVTPSTPATPTTPSAPVGTAPVWDGSYGSVLATPNLDADTIAKLNQVAADMAKEQGGGTNAKAPSGVTEVAPPAVYNQNPAMSGGYGGDVRYLNRTINRENGKEEYRYANGKPHPPKWGGGELYNRLVF